MVQPQGGVSSLLPHPWTAGGHFLKRHVSGKSFRLLPGTELPVMGSPARQLLRTCYERWALSAELRSSTSGAPSGPPELAVPLFCHSHRALPL